MSFSTWFCLGSITACLCARTSSHLQKYDGLLTTEVAIEDYYENEVELNFHRRRSNPQRSRRVRGTRFQRLFDTKPSQGLELSAVVVTIQSGNSYDRLFAKVPQEGVEGTYVATYEVMGSVRFVLEALSRPASKSSASEINVTGLLRDLDAVTPSSVVFNWECDGRFSSETFGSKQERQNDLDLVALLLKRGHMVMFSDFSLKALINEWSKKRLGPNPFVKVGEFHASMQLTFDPPRVAQCPSAQLQRAAELSPTASIHAMSGTIVYTVNKTVAAQTNAYKMTVLSVASKISGFDISQLSPELVCEAGDQQGAAGHVILEYPSGGVLLTSAGHWIELAKLDGVTEDRLLDVAEAEYGKAYRNRWSAEMDTGCGKDSACRGKMAQSFARRLVRQTPSSSRDDRRR